MIPRGSARCGRVRVVSCFVLLMAGLLLQSCKGGSGGGGSSAATVLDPPVEPELPGDQPAFPLLDHVDQADVRDGTFNFAQLFRIGDDLFEAQFTTLDGVGALSLPDGTPLPTRFSRVPPGGGRFTGPNAQACSGCHNTPFGTSAGEAASNVLQDPGLAGRPPFNTRNTISLFGSGLIQRLAEELTEELHSTRDAAIAEALSARSAVTRELVARGISYGFLAVDLGDDGQPVVDTSRVDGVSADLVVRPFGWKGDEPTVRGFSRGAARNELGMEADELVGKGPVEEPDPDGDGVEGELSVGDVTALTLYVAAQETPTTIGAMAARGLISPAGRDFEQARRRGEALFEDIGCAVCHVPEFRLEDAIFEEPTRRGRGGYLDAQLDPLETALDPAAPLRVDLSRAGDFPRPELHPAGGVRLRIFGDLKRHRMGRHLADGQPTSVGQADGSVLRSVDQSVAVVPVDVFLTAELWGVGNTGPWLHDGRAGTLEEAIQLHGEDDPATVGDAGRSEAQESRDAFAALSGEDREAVVTFLKNLILFELPEGE